MRGSDVWMGVLLTVESSRHLMGGPSWDSIIFNMMHNVSIPFRAIQRRVPNSPSEVRGITLMKISVLASVRKTLYLNRRNVLLLYKGYLPLGLCSTKKWVELKSVCQVQILLILMGLQQTLFFLKGRDYHIDNIPCHHTTTVVASRKWTRVLFKSTSLVVLVFPHRSAPNINNPVLKIYLFEMVMYVPSTVRNSNFSPTVHWVASVKSTNTIPHK